MSWFWKQQLQVQSSFQVEIPNEKPLEYNLGVDVYSQKDEHKALKHLLNQQNAETLHQKIFMAQQ